MAPPRQDLTADHQKISRLGYQKLLLHGSPEEQSEISPEATINAGPRAAACRGNPKQCERKMWEGIKVGETKNELR